MATQVSIERKAWLLDKLMEGIAFCMEPATLCKALLPDGNDVDRNELLESTVRVGVERCNGRRLMDDFASTVTQGELRALLLPFAGPALSSELDLRVSFEEWPKKE